MKKLLLGIFIIFITSCNYFTVDPLAVYTIDKGEHYSYSYSFNNRKRENIIAPILITGDRLDFSFRFTDSHKYNHLVKDGGDINKLYGITSTKIHRNSARFGWRYIGNDSFEVFAYSYVRGIRSWELIYTADLLEYLEFSIDVSKKEYTYNVNASWYSLYNTKNIMAFRAFPYFGGNNVAPHTMYFKIVEL